MAARSDLAQILGLDETGAAQLAEPGTMLPDVDGPDRVPREALIASTLARHDALAAATMHASAARVIRDASAAQMQPRVDLVVGLGFTGQLGGGNLGYLFGSFFNNVLGPNASAQIVIEPTVTGQVRGALIRSEAAYTQAAIEKETLERTIGLNVAEAADELESSGAQLQLTDEAVARSRMALATVRRNFDLGTATLFDLILAEDTVTNADLAELSARLGYATALAKLQFARGVLIETRGNAFIAPSQRIMHLSFEDEQ
jgi:outer membrane protein TolC